MRDLIVVVGPTAAGKSVLGAELAARVRGEVISADAFAVYRGLDIGTAKPGPAERSLVPHHLIDVADPASRYSAGMFVRDADRAIADIRARGNVPVVVGGTMFYVRALLYGLFPEPPKDPLARQRLAAAWEGDPAAVRARLEEVDPVAAASIAARDRQRILRALEVFEASGRPISELWRETSLATPRYHSVRLAVSPPRTALHDRIEKRVVAMFSAGLAEEVSALLSGGLRPSVHALKAIGYRECVQVALGNSTESEARDATIVATRRLAKRQLTWLRGERDVSWLSGWGRDAVTEALSLVEAIGGAARQSGG